MTSAVSVRRSLTLEEYEEAWRKLKAVPIMVAVWCVDRPDALGKMREICRSVMPNDQTFAARTFASECPVYEWYARFADADDWARRPECFHTPGVYLQMSTGEYIKVDT